MLDRVLPHARSRSRAALVLNAVSVPLLSPAKVAKGGGLNATTPPGRRDHLRLAARSAAPGGSRKIPRMLPFLR
jgi:hypothetical protein